MQMSPNMAGITATRLCDMIIVWFASALFEPPYALKYAEFHFERFIQQFNRQYADEYEKQAKFLTFKDNFKRVIRMNNDFNNAIFGITKFMDLTLEEFYSGYTGLIRPKIFEEVCTIKTDDDIPHVHVPESFDWRLLNVVTAVKDQKHCNSCYAFSATGNIESQFAIKYKHLVELSEQQIVDCDPRSSGCGGGLMSYAFRSLIAGGGSTLEADYPYLGVNNFCQLNANRLMVKVVDCVSYRLTSQEKLKQLLVMNGPISIAVASMGLHTLLPNRIITDELCTGKVNHGVLLVGYGTENGMPYWIVKNSWGVPKGGDGYFRMQRGEGALSCGMMNDLMVTAIIA